jgi:polygalacturonase
MIDDCEKRFDMELDIKSMGAVSDGKTKNTEIIQRAIDLCAVSGGKVIVSDGVYLTGKLVMKSNVELHISEGAVLLGSPDYDDYPEAETTHVDTKMLPRERNACLIFAECCKNISITGMGTIDCNGRYFVEPRENVTKKHTCTYRRIETLTPPRVVFFTGCENVKIEDITMINQPAGWSYWIHDCAYVTFNKVKILADVHYPNNDGIHINCSHDVSISNCFITCGDDCIVVRANSISLEKDTPCERVCVSNCTLTSYTNGVRIGWINDGTIRNCVFSNIVITDSNNGIGINLPYRVRQSGNVRLFDPSNPISTDVGREETLIENILFENVIMNNIYHRPISVSVDENLSIHCKGINNIRFSNLHATALKYPSFVGRQETPIENIYFYNCSFSVKDEIDGEKGKKIDMVQKYADKVHFINTEFN